MIVSVIPARGGSKGIPRKNLVELDGHPLIYYSIIPSLESIVDRTIVSTDDPEIADVSKELGAEVLERPQILSGDTVPTEPVVEHLCTSLDLQVDDTVVLLQPTQPIRCAELIDKVIGSYMAHSTNSFLFHISNRVRDSVFTAHREKYYHWKAIFPPISSTPYQPPPKYEGVGFDFRGTRAPRQGVEVEVRENGNVYVTNPLSYINHNRFGTNPRPYLTHPICGMELDDPWQVPILSSVLRSIRMGELSWDQLILEDR